MKFEKYRITPEIKRNLAELGFKRPTDIQFKSIPSIMKGEDVLAIAQTGTGKTAAFAIPLLDKIQRAKSSKRSQGIKCLIMVPTRELSQQIGEFIAKLAKHTRVNVFALYGGVEQDQQVSSLQNGIDILVATPGRMFDLIKQGHIDLKQVETLVLDEADHMLGLGFIEDIKFVKEMLRQRHQTLFFSATIDREIKKLAFSQVKSNAIRIQIAPEDPVSKNVSHFVMFVEMDDKRFFLEKFIYDNPDSKVLVFVRTRVRAERVAKAMDRAGIEACWIHGDKDQKERLKVMKLFKENDVNLLIATDVSARGIDIPDIDFVINYDLPEIPEHYVHRVGRTGRGIQKGSAVSYCSKQEKPLLEAIEKWVGKKIEVLKITKKTYSAVVADKTGTGGLQDNWQALLDAEERANAKNQKKRKK